MQKTLVSGKIHRVRVTMAELNYVGSCTIDVALMKAANIAENEQIHVVNVSRKNAARIITYAIPGKQNSGIVCLNGAAAHHFKKNDIAIIMAYSSMSAAKAKTFKPHIVFVDAKNRICSKQQATEKHGPTPPAKRVAKKKPARANSR